MGEEEKEKEAEGQSVDNSPSDQNGDGTSSDPPSPPDPLSEFLKVVESLMEAGSTFSSPSETSALTKRVSEILNLNDYYVDLQHSVLVDFYVNALEFSTSHGLSKRKTKAFLALCEEVRLLLVNCKWSDSDPSRCLTSDDDIQLEKSLQSSLRDLLRNVRKHDLLGEPLASEVSSEPEEEKKEEEEKEKEPPSKPPPKKSKKELEAEEEERKRKEEELARQRAEAAAARAAALAPREVFSAEELKAISHYVCRGPFEFKRLYAFLFNNKQEKVLYKYPVWVTTAFDYQNAKPLSLALDETKYAEMLEEQRLQEEEAIRKKEEEEKLAKEEEERKEREAKEALERETQEKLDALKKEIEALSPEDLQKLGTDLVQKQELLLKRLDAIESKIQ